VGMNKKILPQFFVRGQPLMPEHLFGVDRGHIS
jgi:hypothetical protein